MEYDSTRSEALKAYAKNAQAELLRLACKLINEAPEKLGAAERNTASDHISDMVSDIFSLKILETEGEEIEVAMPAQLEPEEVAELYCDPQFREGGQFGMGA